MERATDTINFKSLYQKQLNEKQVIEPIRNEFKVVMEYISSMLMRTARF